MSWLKKLLPPKIKREAPSKKSIPEGLWSKCVSCEAVLYRSDLDSNLGVCPKCGHHQRIRARARMDMLLDPEGRERTDTFLKANPQWSAHALDLPIGRSHGEGARLTPYHDGTDGFFIARLDLAC